MPDRPRLSADRAWSEGATADESPVAGGAKSKRSADPRAERLAAALRANLAKRKAAARMTAASRERGAADETAD